MTVSKDLLLAILSMDSYNRIYGEGISGLGGAGSQIGTATLQALPNGINLSDWQTAGFYAAAYSTQYGTVISYRGTDNLFSSPLPWSDAPGSDIWNGYGTGAGLPFNDQARMAAEFYQAVTGTSTSDPTTGSAILTGHSLGGGLAGLIAAIYRQQGYLFNNMPFELAATTLREAALLNPNVLNDFYNGGSINHLLLSSNLHAFATTGELLTLARAFQTTQPEYFDSNGGFPSNPIDLHSMALHAILQFADDPQSGVTTEWYSIGNVLWDAGFNDTIGQAAGFSPTGTGGAYSEAYKMLTAIAYSAIDEGTRVFGDVGIRAMFNDADDLGRVVSMADASTTILAAKGALAEILVQFAGEMAFRKVLMTSDPDADEGVLSVSPDNSVLTVDFSDALWSIGGASSDYIIGRETLTDEVIGTAGPLGVADTRTAMQWLWGDSNSSVIDRIAMATTNAGTVFTIPDRAVPSPDKATIFAAGGGNDTITGSKDNDFIVGGEGIDIMSCCHDLQLLEAA